MQDETTKKCRRCGEAKSLDAFSPTRATCRDCRFVQNREYRERTAEHIRAHKRQAYLADRDRILAEKRKPCPRCGGIKPPGERRRYCDACIPLVAEEVREKNNEQSRAWAKANPEHRKAYSKVYAAANREAMRANARRWHHANPEKTREKRQRWQAANPELIRMYEQRRRSLKKAQFVEDVHPLVLLELDDGVCGICGKDVDPADFTIDHMVPLSKGGEHSYFNTQVAHPRCNFSKGGKLPY